MSYRTSTVSSKRTVTVTVISLITDTFTSQTRPCRQILTDWTIIVIRLSRLIHVFAVDSLQTASVKARVRPAEFACIQELIMDDN